MLWFVIFIITLVTCTWLYFQYAFSYWSRRGVPNLPPSIPWGNNKDLIFQHCGAGEMCLKLYKKLKKPGRKFAGTYCFTRPEFLILDPELAKQILLTDFKCFPDRGYYCNEKDEPLTAHLLNLRNEKWKALRQKLSPAFSVSKLKIIFQIMIANSIKLQKILWNCTENEEYCDCKDLSTRLTIDNITLCGLGVNSNSLDNPDSEFRKYSKKNYELTPYLWMKVILSFVCPSLLKLLKMKKIDKGITDFFNKTVTEIIEYREKNNIERNDFLQLLINIKNSGNVDSSTLTKFGGRFTIREIIPQVFIFTIAGFDTTAAVVTFFLYDMATNLNIQEKVREEIIEVLMKHDGELTYECINEMSYLDRALNESMRMHPLIPVLHRRSVVDYRIPGTDIILEKDTTVLIPTIGFSCDPEFYPSPEIFDPERFSPDEKLKRHSSIHIPFGEGPRGCIAMRLGWLQSKAAIVAFMRNNSFTLNSRTKVPLKISIQNFVATVQDGVWLNIAKC